MLYMADPAVSSPLACHSFRAVTPDPHGCIARSATVGVTRVSPSQINALLQPSTHGEDVRTMLRSTAPDTRDPSMQTLAMLGLDAGDYLEVAIDMGRIR